MQRNILNWENDEEKALQNLKQVLKKRTMNCEVHKILNRYAELESNNQSNKEQNMQFNRYQPRQ